MAESWSNSSTMKPNTLTCHKCNVSFAKRADAIKHYSERWHQYNLMRLLKDQSTITEETYLNIMGKSKYLEEAKNRVNLFPCSVCKKSFNSQGSHETHCKSQKHKLNIARKAAENIRRLEIQKIKEAKRNQSDTVVTEEAEVAAVSKGPEYCTACKAAFASEKDFQKHAQTRKHIVSLKLLNLAAERKQELKDQDEQLATGADEDDDMEVEEVDSDEWEDDDAEMKEQQEENSCQPLPLSSCLFCPKRSANLTDNLGHMERNHNFIVPHKEAANLEQLQQYLGEKIGALHQCLECSKQFRSLRACRLHMADKPHLTIRFEGEYDQYFDLMKILADVQLPANPLKDNIFNVVLRNGNMLTHRDLKNHFRQNLTSTQLGVKRLRSSGPAAITHLGKNSKDKTIAAIRKDNERQKRDLRVMHKKQDKKYLVVAQSANKLQKHFRPQVINAG